MAYKTLVFTSNAAQTVIAKDATNFDTITLKTIHITNQDGAKINVNLLLDGTTDQYILHDLSLPVNTSVVLDHDIQYNASDADLKITCAATDGGTAVYSILISYEILLKVNR